MHRILPATLALLILAGCAKQPVPIAIMPVLPDLPKQVTEACRKPVAKAGDDARVVAAQMNAARLCEAGKRAALVGFYGDLKTGLAGK